MNIYVLVLLFLWLVFLAVPALFALRRKELRHWLSGGRFINRLLLDRLEKRQNPVYGFTLFCGVQGGGKTYSAVQYIDRLVTKYHCNVISNTPLNCEHIFIKSVSEIPYLIQSGTNYVIFLDEIQTLFDSRKMDDDFYTIFCQLRKRGIKVVGTSQIFERCALPLREQVHELYYCRTFFGCLTLKTKVFPLITSSGKMETKRLVLGREFSIQNSRIRSMYDTFYKI